MELKNLIPFKTKTKIIPEVKSEEYYGNDSSFDDDWLEDDYEEGQLSVDVFQTKDKLIVKSTIAGVKPEDLNISLHNDMLTIKGKRKMEEEISDDNYFARECYWGSFSRSIILPIEISAEKKVDAYLENGVLTVILPKAKPKQVAIKVKEI